MTGWPYGEESIAFNPNLHVFTFTQFDSNVNNTWSNVTPFSWLQLETISEKAISFWDICKLWILPWSGPDLLKKDSRIWTTLNMWRYNTYRLRQWGSLMYIPSCSSGVGLNHFYAELCPTAVLLLAWIPHIYNFVKTSMMLLSVRR
jgi:hypothetical protein